MPASGVALIYACLRLAWREQPDFARASCTTTQVDQLTYDERRPAPWPPSGHSEATSIMEYDDTGVPAPANAQDASSPAPASATAQDSELQDSEIQGSDVHLGERLAQLRGAPRPGFETRQLRNQALAAMFDEPLEPKKIGRFTIVRQLGAGGMGVVYMAYDERLDRRVAVKLLRGGTVSIGARARLEREAKAMAQLSHPNVVTVYDVGPFEDQVYIAMEFVDGEDLRSWSGGDPRAWRVIVEMFRQAGDGLAAAHAAGIVHRDFKPDNVLVGNDGRARVADFGLANAFDGTTEPGEASPEHDSAPTGGSLTRTGTVMGTPAYMAPEQHAGAATDARSDQFSFCVALWEALYDERPFDTRNYARLVQAIENGELRAPPAAAEVPAWLHEILRRGLATDPDQRWPSMRALLDALTRDPAARRRKIVSWAAGTTAIAVTITALTWFSATQVRDSAREHYWSSLTEDLLDLERERALQQSLEEARRARDAARMSVMRDYAPKLNEIEREDPTAAAALLVEVSEEARASPTWKSAANMLLGQPLSHRVLVHSDAVAPLSFSPDGRWLYAGTAGGEVWRWDPLSGAGELIITHSAEITDLAVSPDGEQVASSSSDGTARTWDASSRRERVVAEHGRKVTSIAFDPSGNHLIAGSKDGRASLVDLRTGTQVSLQVGEAVHDVAFDATGTRMVMSGAKHVHLWDRDESRELALFRGHRGPIFHARALEGQRIVTASDDGTARLWSYAEDAADSGEILVRHDAEITALDVDPEQQRIATSALDGSIRVTSLSAPHHSISLPRHARAAWSVAFTPSGEHVASASFDRTARLARSDGRGVPIELTGHSLGLFELAIAPGGRWLATGSYDRSIRIWDMQRSRLTTALAGHTQLVFDIEFGPSAEKAVTASHDGTARVWELSTGAELGERINIGAPLNHVAFSPDGAHIALASARFPVSSWEPHTGVRRDFVGHSASVNWVSFDARSERLLSASCDQTARVWSIATGEELARLPGHKGCVTVAEFERDGARVVTASRDGNVRIWQTATASLEATLRGHTGQITAMVRSPDGRVLATGSNDGTARLWPSERSVDALQLAGHGNVVWSLAYDTSGARLLTASLDGSARIWDTSDGSLLHELPGHVDGVRFASFIDERRVVTAAADGALRLWSLDGELAPLVLFAHDKGISSMAVAPGGVRMISGALDGEVTLWRLDLLDDDHDSLFSRLFESTSFCVPSEHRVMWLRESNAEAIAAQRSCERSHAG